MRRAIGRVLATGAVSLGVLAFAPAAANAGPWGVAGWFWGESACLNSGAIGQQRGYWYGYYCENDPAHRPPYYGPWKLVVHYT